MRVISAKSVAVALALMFAATNSTRAGAQNPNASAAASANSSAPQGPEEDVQGTLRVIVEDAIDHTTVHHFLDTDRGPLRLIEKLGNSELAGLETGTLVKVRGRKNANNTELELSGNNSTSGSSVTTLALAAPNTFGEQRTVVLLVNFQDNTSTPLSWTDASYVTFGQVSDYYRANSYNQAWLTGDVYGWFTIPMSGSVCDANQLASLADQAATKAGVNLNNYTRHVYSFPQNACAWWGYGTIGGNPSQAWINGSFQLKVVAHELGHNFGDYHSHSLPCEAGSCTSIEYGDDRDMMGQTGTGHFHAYQKERLGWLNYGSSPTIQTVTSSGTYHIGSFEAGGAPSALKVLKSSASSTDKTYYYLEARTQSDYDAPYPPGVILHTGNSLDGSANYEVDLDPITSAFDSLLDPGQTFTDAAAGFSVTTISADASGAWVSITYAGAPCTSAAPTVTLSPGSTVTAPGTTAVYNMTVKDNDDVACASAGFGIGMGVPTGWAWTAAQSSITLLPGTTANTSIYVTPPGTASGSTSVNAQASRLTTGPSGSATATLTVASGLTVTLKTVGGSNYQVTATVLAGTVPAVGISVTFTITDPKGGVNTVTATTNSSGVATVKGKLKGKDPHGTYQVTAAASSGALSGVATGTFVY